jgi:hypothetical protein
MRTRHDSKSLGTQRDFPYEYCPSKCKNDKNKIKKKKPQNTAPILDSTA